MRGLLLNTVVGFSPIAFAVAKKALEKLRKNLLTTIRKTIVCQSNQLSSLSSLKEFFNEY
jgi:hypothetical protein